ncbi:MAG: bifunctional (p)ppGpp synthetase/guanosine-3',5'-bis(diphosphate) 3'-pyrophosphohydrolase [Actinomycetota bacterium]
MSLIERVMPWQRGVESPDSQLANLLRIHGQHHPDEDPAHIVRAFEWGINAHDGQMRKSGEPYIQHPIEVATIVAEQGLDAAAVAAAIMHDAVEDTDIALSEIEDSFSAEIAAIIDGCTKVDRLQFDSKEEQQAATVRKLLVAVAKDIRVLIIKLADRLHNMRTLAVLPEWKQQRTAGETLHVFAPLAHRLGMEELKTQLEDLSFAALHPKWYAEIDHMVALRDPERDIYLTQFIGEVEARLAELGISADVIGRSKHLWSIYEKMVVKGREFDDIYDLVGVRVICDSVRDCYGAIGSIHANWRPVQGRFKDFIAMPKFNLYQSLHTTVVGPQGKMVEFQVRTNEMHARAQRGMAAHWAYKDSLPSDDLEWLNRIVDFSDGADTPSQFMANLRDDLEQEEISIFTPKGKIITLPVGSTPVDFAYAIHTEIGNNAVGAQVNGRMVGLDQRLGTGDVVEVFTSQTGSAAPSEEWLSFVTTHRAINNIRRWHSRERHEDQLATARDDVANELRRKGLPVYEVMRSSTLTEIADDMGYQDADALFAAIGAGHVNPGAVVSRAQTRLQGDDSPKADERVATSALAPRPNRGDRKGAGVHVEGFDEHLVRLAKCCKPVPPDDITGFVTRGRGVAIHRTDCTNAVAHDDSASDRVVDAEWDVAGVGSFVATIEVRALDRMHLLVDVAQTMTDQHVNIIAVSTRTREDRVAVMQFDFELSDAAQIQAILQIVRDIDGVYEAHRVLNDS